MFRRLFFVALAICCGWTAPASAQRLKTSGHYLVTESGAPFFWLGDTAWEMFHRLNREEARYYLRNRAAKGFTVVQAVLLGEMNGLTVPNREGQLPLVDLDPVRPNERYFELVDHLVDYAAEVGLYMALLPTWGAHVEDKPHPLFQNLHPFTPENAEAYGRFLGRRYANRANVVWVLGGDRPPVGHEAIWDAMARGIKAGGGRQIMTYHPWGGRSSSEWLHGRAWLDFNMLQGGHQRYSSPDYEMVTRDFLRSPIKPTLNAETSYEEGFPGGSDANPRFTDYDVRKTAYWSVFAGAFGHTYGHNSLWQIFRADDSLGVVSPITPWREALEAPGAAQLQHLKNLMLSRPYLSRIPDQTLLVDQDGTGFPAGRESDHVQVTRDGRRGRNDASYIFAYLPIVRGVTLNTRVISGDSLRAWWYDPRTGAAFPLGKFPNKGTFSPSWEHRIRKEMGGPDWVLVVEDAARTDPPPGTPRHAAQN